MDVLVSQVLQGCCCVETLCGNSLFVLFHLDIVQELLYASDCLTESDATMVKYAIGGLCNLCLGLL